MEVVTSHGQDPLCGARYQRVHRARGQYHDHDHGHYHDHDY